MDGVASWCSYPVTDLLNLSVKWFPSLFGKKACARHKSSTPRYQRKFVMCQRVWGHGKSIGYRGYGSNLSPKTGLANIMRSQCICATSSPCLVSCRKIDNCSSQSKFDRSMSDSCHKFVAEEDVLCQLIFYGFHWFSMFFCSHPKLCGSIFPSATSRLLASVTRGWQFRQPFPVQAVGRHDIPKIKIGTWAWHMYV